MCSTYKKILEITCFLGFLTGIIFADVLVDSYIAQTDLFSEYYLRRYLDVRIEGIFFYIKIGLFRILPILIMIAMKHTRGRVCVIMAFLFWTCFSAGVLVSVELINLGAFGIVFFLMGIFPQAIFYCVAYASVICRCLQSHSEEWSGRYLCIILMMIVIGVVLEMFVNPLLIRMIIRIRFAIS